MIWFLILPFSLGIVIAILKYWIVFVPETERLIVTLPRLNRIRRILKPGIHLVLRPFERGTHWLDYKPRRLDLLLDRVRSMDGVPFKVRGVVIYQLNIDTLPFRNLYNLLPILTYNPAPATKLYFEEGVRSWLGTQFTSSLVQSINLGSVANQLLPNLIANLETNGIKVVRFFLTEIVPPAAVQQALVAVQSQPFNSHAQTELLQAIRNCSTSWQPEERDFAIALQEVYAMADNQTDMSSPLAWDYLFQRMNRR